MSSWIDRSLPGVLIQQLITHGPIFDTYQGKLESSSLPIAINVYHTELGDDVSSMELFDKTSRLLSTMDHPNITRIYELSIADNQAYLVHEHLTDLSLQEYLLELSIHGLLLPIHIVARILNSIGSAIDYAHARGILHRNLNPSNIILCPTTSSEHPSLPLPAQFKPVVADFSLAHILGLTIETRLKNAYSHPSYLSPEQMQGEEIDKRTDIYSLGVLLYEMISGSAPEPPSKAEPGIEVSSKRPPLLDNIPTPAAAVVQRAMARNPDARFQRAIDLVDEFEHATGFKPGPFISVPDSPRSAPPPTLKMKAPQIGRERFVALIFTIFIIILGLSTLGVLAYLASKFLGNLGQAPAEIEFLGATSLLPALLMDNPDDKS